jgi:hypothetical protein
LTSGHRIAPALLAFLLGTACATINVNVDYDDTTDFGSFRTFALLPEPPATGNLRADNPLLHNRIRTAIGEQLKLQGYVRTGDPQMRVGYHVSTQQRLDVRTVDSVYGYGHWRYGRPGGALQTTEVRQYEQGALVIDIVDAARNTLVWRGVGEARLRTDPTPEQMSQRVREAVAAILKRFPPGGGG